MLNKNELREAAEVAFNKALTRELDWASSKCWARNLRSSLEGLNDVLSAGKEFGIAGDCRLFTNDELEELTNDIKPLRSLDMSSEAKTHIIRVLVEKHGVPAIVFASKGSGVTQEA